MGQLEQWIHIEYIRLFVHHFSATIVAILVFALTGWLVSRLIPDGPGRRAAILVDEAILVAVLALCGWKLLVYLATVPGPDLKDSPGKKPGLGAISIEPGKQCTMDGESMLPGVRITVGRAFRRPAQDRLVPGIAADL